MNPSIPFFRPTISQREVDAVAESLRSGWLTSGPRVAEFESRFAAIVGAEYAVALNSCTAALHLALLACGVGPGDEVLVPSLTFAATAETVIAVGATPVLVDCDKTLHMDMLHAEKLVNRSTRAIMPMHYGGAAANMDAALDLAERNPRLRVIEDAAHAFPARYDGSPIGSIGDATCFSFYANKTITTGEGGMLTTNDEQLAERARTLSLHGLNKAAWARYETRAAWDYDILEPGWKYNMTDAAAALGLVQVERSLGFAEMRRSIALQYSDRFVDAPGVEPVPVEHLEESACHLYVVRVDSTQCRGGGRDDFIDFLRQRNIGTSVHYRPLHMHSYYQETLGDIRRDLPMCTEAFDQIVSLPLFPGMTDSEIDAVSDAVCEFANGW